ncbi:MAG: helix-turn-helix domain-containing protein [Yersiniaceae bacterium]|uniref:Transcriptional regulator n=2 Tax=Chimaeribacter coloradensis TaxID=2060068 RepID=A0A2N5DY70_9GAMM|nr:helix-turn-helix domain-containing protein [Chimaeribacter coloradensis]MDU6411042.1 helix-turn-helix domain-containing protein [Yersiniaceae bacterium]PLR32455.1 transcriptional regulator [Chimaeribacter coloradensis]
MKRKNLGDERCPIARSLARVGEWWSLLIIRDAFHGLSRFDEFQQSLAIAPNILSRRLATLVENGLLEKTPYSTRPLRYEYRLTPAGRGLEPVLFTLLQWGNAHFSPEGASIALAARSTGTVVEPVLFDPVHQTPVSLSTHHLVAGPAADEKMVARLARAAAEHQAESANKENTP